MTSERPPQPTSGVISVHTGGVTLTAHLNFPDRASALIMVIGREGNGHFSSETLAVTRRLDAAGFATVVFDVMTGDESSASSNPLRFDVNLLARRLEAVTNEMRQGEMTRGLPIGYYASGTRAAAALIAAANHPEDVAAVASRAGRPDLAISLLPRIRAATLLIASPAEHALEHINRDAMRYLRCEKRFAASSNIETTAALVEAWFKAHVRDRAIA